MNVFHQFLRELLARLLFLFVCRVTSTLPKEHRKGTNKSFGPRYAKGFYLHSDSATPSVWMFDMISRTAMMVSDFKAYHEISYARSDMPRIRFFHTQRRTSYAH